MNIMTKQIRTRLAVLTAMFAALTIVTTAFIKIPAPLGYIHIGDSMIYTAAAVLPGPFGFFSAAIGGAMADLIAGYPHWALPTAIIKSLNVLPFFLVNLALRDSDRAKRILSVPVIMALIPSTLITLGGYFVANMLMYDTAAAIAELLPNLVQALAGAVLFIILGLGLDSMKFKQKVLSLGNELN